MKQDTRFQIVFEGFFWGEGLHGPYGEPHVQNVNRVTTNAITKAKTQQKNQQNKETFSKFRNT